MTIIRTILFISIVFFFLISCTTVNRNEGANLVDSLSISSKHNDNPKVEVKISAPNTTFKFGDRIILNIKLTNRSKTNQRILFDKPIVSTGGPWATSATVTDIKTNRNVVKYQNKAVLSSQIYSDEKLDGYYYYLFTGQSIEGKYDLNDIIVLNSADDNLQKGIYAIQLFYCENASNTLEITIK